MKLRMPALDLLLAGGKNKLAQFREKRYQRNEHYGIGDIENGMRVGNLPHGVGRGSSDGIKEETVFAGCQEGEIRSSQKVEQGMSHRRLSGGAAAADGGQLGGNGGSNIVAKHQEDRSLKTHQA